jgi:hypothetical protein
MKINVRIVKTILFVVSISFNFLVNSIAYAEDFSVIVIPDMHVDDLKNNPANQIKWIRDNQVSENIVLLTAVGDYLTRGNSSASWQKVRDAWKPLFELKGGATDPFNSMAASFSLGNHDYDSWFLAPTGEPRGWRKTKSTTYRNLFGKNNWLTYPWYGQDDLNDENHVQFIHVDGYTLMHIDLEWDIGNSSGQSVTGITSTEAARRLQWVDTILYKYNNYPSMITTHDYLLENGTLSAAGKKIWAVIKKHPNVFLVNSGHVCKVSNDSGAGSGAAIAQRPGMGPVLQLLSDYQNFRISRAWTRQLKFTGSTTQKRLSWTTFSVSSSPRIDLTDSKSRGSWVMNFNNYGVP